MTRITATEAARQFSDLLNRAFYRREDFELERNGQVVARLVPPRQVARVADLEKLFALRSDDPRFADDLTRSQEAMNTPLSHEDPWER